MFAVHEIRLELDSIVIGRFDGRGEFIDTVRVIADRNHARSVQAGGGLVTTMHWEVSYTARAFMRSDGVRPIVGRSDSFELELLGPAGEAQTVLRVLGVQNPMTADEIRAREEQTWERNGLRERDPSLWRAFGDFLPERLPAFGNVVVSDRGNVWISLAAYDWSEGLDWLVFTSVGELRGTVHTPPGLRVSQVSGGSIVGYVLDEFDVPYVRRHPLIR